MRISQVGLDLIKEFEGLELEAYQDIVGIWTIGYGHTSMAGPPEVVPGMEITRDEAEEILRSDLRPFERAIEDAVKVAVTQNMFDALCSITFNIGPNAMRNSTFIRKLNEGDYEGCADAMLMWNKAGGQVVAGLKRRREAERALFLKGYDEDEGVGSDVRGLPVEEDSGRRGNLASSRTMTGAGTAGTAGAAAVAATVMDGGEKTEGEASSTDTPTGTSTTADTTTTTTPTGEEETYYDYQTAEEMVAQTGDDLFVSRFEGEDANDAIVVGAGAIAVLAAVFVMIARFDDWRNHRR